MTLSRILGFYKAGCIVQGLKEKHAAACKEAVSGSQETHCEGGTAELQRCQTCRLRLQTSDGRRSGIARLLE